MEVGEPGKGKSLMMADVAARITRGLPLPDEAEGREPGWVIYLNAEDHPAAVTRTRLEAAGADLDRVHILDVGTRQIMLPSQLGWLEWQVRRIREKPGSVLVVLDPLNTILDPALDPNNGKDIREVLDPLGVLAARHSVSVGVIHHLNKSIERSGIYRVAGSGQIVGAARYVMTVGPDPEDEESAVRHVGVIKSNGVTAPTLQFEIRARALPGLREAAPYVVWQGASPLTARALTEAPSREHQTKLAECRAWLTERLTPDPVPAALMEGEAAALGYSKRTLDRAKRGLVVSERAAGSKVAWLWKLTGSPNAAAGEEER